MIASSDRRHASALSFLRQRQSDVYHPVNRADFAIVGCRASLAAQPKLGLRAKWLAYRGCRHLARATVDGSITILVAKLKRFVCWTDRLAVDAGVDLFSSVIDGLLRFFDDRRSVLAHFLRIDAKRRVTIGRTELQPAHRR